MTAKLSRIIGLNRSINTVTNNNGNRNNRHVSSASTNGGGKRKLQDGGGGGGGGSGGGWSEKQPLWKTKPYKEKIEGKFYQEKLYNRFRPEQKLYSRFSPKQKAQHYELEGGKGKAGLKNRSVQAAATSSNSDSEGAGESFGKNARKKKK